MSMDLFSLFIISLSKAMSHGHAARGTCRPSVICYCTVIVWWWEVLRERKKEKTAFTKWVFNIDSGRTAMHPCLWLMFISITNVSYATKRNSYNIKTRSCSFMKHCLLEYVGFNLPPSPPFVFMLCYLSLEFSFIYNVKIKKIFVSTLSIIVQAASKCWIHWISQDEVMVTNQDEVTITKQDDIKITKQDEVTITESQHLTQHFVKCKKHSFHIKELDQSSNLSLSKELKKHIT